MLAGATVAGAVVWWSVAADALALREAGWAGLIGLAFPALMGFLVWRDRG